MANDAPGATTVSYILLQPMCFFYGQNLNLVESAPRRIKEPQKPRFNPEQAMCTLYPLMFLRKVIYLVYQKMRLITFAKK